MYHKESGTGNDPFLAGNMLCRRRSLSPLRISALINLLRLFSTRERETYHLDRRCTLSLASFQSTLCTLRPPPSRDIARDATAKNRCALMNPDRCQNATRKSRGSLLLRYTCVGKHRVSLNCNKIKLEESYLLFVLCEVAKTCCDEHVFLETSFENKDV